MAEQLDVYRDWLRIKETARPLTYYQLLRLPAFEDRTAKIRDHYRKMNAHVRKFATGDYSVQSQQLLNELAKAMLCLTDVQRKREYDASLGREETGEGRRRTLEEILLAEKTVDRDQLAKARSYAGAVGLEVREAVVQQKMASAEAVMVAYAESVGLPYVELEDVGVDEALISQIPPTLARQHSCVPVMIDENQLLMASPNPIVPNVEEELRLRFDMPVRTVLCTPAGVNAVITEHYPSDTAVKQSAAQEKSATPKPGQQPLSQDEKLKRRKTAAMVGFCATFLLSMAACMLFRGGMTLVGFADVVLVLIGAAIVAAGAFFGAMRSGN